MVENLKVSKYNDGTTIPNVNDASAWNTLSSGALCNYNNDIVTGAKYGKLYNWYAVNTDKLAPVGWHIPTDAEWAILNNYVTINFGTSVSVAKALADKTDWRTATDTGSPGNDISKNNSTGFTALPAGYRDFEGIFDWISNGYWWSSTQNDANNAWGWDLDRYESGLNRSDHYKGNGLSVRCVRD
jgi:uncharacterized protein (TIGR02145 family)